MPVARQPSRVMVCTFFRQDRRALQRREGPAKGRGPAAGAPYLRFLARHSAFIGKRPFGRIAPPQTNHKRGDGMTEVLRAVLVDLVNLVKASRLPEESERTVLRCLGQLPP